MVFLLGNFNTQVGRKGDRWYPSLNKFRVGKEKSNGYRLLQFCWYNNLVISNTVVGHKMAHTLKWYSRNGKTDNLSDSFVVNRRLANQYKILAYIIVVSYVKTKDNHLVVSRANLKLKNKEE